jgi:hypothetical protein
MLKLVKVLGVLAALFTTVDRASALSFTASAPFTYSITNQSTFAIQGDIEFYSGLIPGSGTLQGQTDHFTLLTNQTFTEVINGLSGPLNTLLHGGGDGTPTKFAEAVPLPAGLPLFAMALLALGAFGYFGARRKVTDQAATSVA